MDQIAPINGHSLVYVRRATVEQDGKTGLLFLHKWATGEQHLIFQGLSGAQRWITAVSRSSAQFP